jgi:hypothetical protein
MSQYQTAAGFPTTHWSRVLRAADPTDREGRDALERLCRDYWYPPYAFARRRGLDREQAGDLVQCFLADLIERRDLIKADPSRGRFRSFLRTACSHFCPMLAIMTGLSSEAEGELRSRSTCKTPKDVTSTNRPTI